MIDQKGEPRALEVRRCCYESHHSSDEAATPFSITPALFEDCQ